MKYNWLLLLLLLLMAGCASIGKAQIPDLVSLDEALAAAAADVGSRVHGKTEIAVAGLGAPLSDISDFITDELNVHFVNGGKFKVLERNAASLAVLNAEHQFQMSGFVSDESAVGIGRYLGAKVIITGSFFRFEGFSQLRLRALDVRTAKILSLSTTRIQPNDAVLASIMKPLDNVKPLDITEKTLAHLNCGEDFIRAGKYNKAIRDLNRVLAINKDITEGYFLRGVAYEMKGERDQAIADYTAALKINPDNADALNNRGGAYLMKGDYDLAIADYTAAQKKEPDDAGVLSNRGFAYLKKGDTNLAIADLNATLEIKPDHVSALNNRGSVYYLLGYYPSAIKDFTAAIWIKPDDANVLNNRGLAYTENNRLFEAIEDFTTALNLKPDYAAALFHRANVYYKLGNNNRDNTYFDSAIADYTAALKINPDNADALNNRAFVCLRNGDNDQAIKDYTAMLKLKPDDVDKLFYRGTAYYNKCDPKWSYIDSSLYYDWEWEWLSKKERAERKRAIDRAIADCNLAIADYTTVLRIRPGYVDALYNRGEAYTWKGDYNLAIADYTATLRILSSYIDTLNKHGEVDTAITVANFADTLKFRLDYASAQKNYYDVLNKRGIAYFKNGDLNRAISDWEAVKQINPTHMAKFYIEWAKTEEFEYIWKNIR